MLPQTFSDEDDVRENATIKVKLQVNNVRIMILCKRPSFIIFMICKIYHSGNLFDPLKFPDVHFHKKHLGMYKNLLIKKCGQHFRM